MAALIELRTYTLKTAAAAKAYAPYWRHHMASLQKEHNVKTIGVFESRATPEKVIAIVQYPRDSDPAAVMKSYTTSETFKKDLEGFDKSQFASIEGVVIEPTDFSPNQW